MMMLQRDCEQKDKETMYICILILYDLHSVAFGTACFMPGCLTDIVLEMRNVVATAFVCMFGCNICT
jgi:hypothetical protein